MKNRWLKFFEDSTATNDDDGEERMLLERLRLFISSFPYQSAHYKIVWLVRIVCWLLVAALAVFGAVVKIMHLF